MADDLPAKRKRTGDQQTLKCLAFSDDLSGATDAGGEFLQAGLDARALLYTESSVRCDALGDCDVLIVDTDSRSVDIPHALLNLRSASHRLENVEALVYYKKIDSTVRGNLAAEVDCLMQDRSFDVCFFAPALPHAGRITVGGYHLLNGVPITNTDIGHGISSSSLLTLLSDMKSADIVHIDLNTVIQGSEAISKIAVGHLSGNSTQRTVFVCDASNQQDLQSVVQAAKFTSEKLDRTMLLCGSSGIAKEIPNVFHLQPRKNREIPADWSLSSGEGVLIVCGSQHDVTSQQVKQLMQEVPLQELVIRPGQKIDDESLSEGHVLVRMEGSATNDRSALEFLSTAAVQILSKRRFQGSSCHRVAALRFHFSPQWKYILYFCLSDWSPTQRSVNLLGYPYT